MCPLDRAEGPQRDRRLGQRDGDVVQNHKKPSGSISRISIRSKSISSLRVAHRDTIVPKGDIVLLPLEAYVKLLRRSNDLIEVSDDGVTLCLWDANDLSDEASIVEQRLPAGDGIRADQGMLGDDRITTNWAAQAS